MALEELTVLDPDDVRSSLFAWGFALDYGIVIGNPQPHPIPGSVAEVSLRDCFQAMGQIVPAAKEDFEQSTDSVRNYILKVENRSHQVRMELRRDDPLIRGVLIISDGEKEHVALSFDVKSDVEQAKGYIGYKGILLPITTPPRSTD